MILGVCKDIPVVYSQNGLGHFCIFVFCAARTAYYELFPLRLRETNDESVLCSARFANRKINPKNREILWEVDFL